VGRTILIGHLDGADQVLVATLLSVFVDERTGTTAKLVRFASRDEALEALRQDRVSLYVDHAGALLARLEGAGSGARDPAAALGRLKEMLNARCNAVWIASLGYDRRPAGAAQAARAGEAGEGPAGVLLCRDALSRFPALPRLVAKLSGVLDNGTLAALLREAERSDPRAAARRFLKSRRLV